MIRTAAQLADAGDAVHRHVTIRTAVPGAQDLAFIDHLQKKYSHQLGFLPRQALEAKIERGQVSIAFENDEPAAYVLGNGNYLRDPHFGVIYQAAVSYDARRRLMGTALVQHFIDNMCPNVRLVGLWCAQDIEANEFWSACGFEAIAARHGSRRRGRVHIFWVGRVQRNTGQRPMPLEPLRYPRSTRGGLMRARREVYAIEPGSAYREIELPPEVEGEASREEKGSRDGDPASSGGGGSEGSRGKRAGRRSPARRRCHGAGSLSEAQRAFRYGGSKHICVVIAGATRYLPVAPFDMPDFADLARVMVAAA